MENGLLASSFKATKWAGLTCLTRLGAALLSATALSVMAHTPAQTPAPGAAPSLEQLFRAEPYRGENAKEAAFSHSGRYLAYLWNPFGEPGTDLYVYDRRSGKTLRLSSPALMAAFDAPEDLARFARKLQQKRSELAERQAKEVAQQAYLQGQTVDMSQWEAAALLRVKQEYADKKALDEAKKVLDKALAAAEKLAFEAMLAKRSGSAALAASAAAASAAAAAADKPEKEKELWEWRDELKKSLAKNKLKPADLYPGASQVVWAHRRDELIVQYRGSLFRWVAGDAQLTPLQTTQRELRIAAFTADDQGYVFMDDKRVLRARFASGGVQLISRELIHPDEAEQKYSIESAVISEDGRWLSLVGRAPLKPPGDDGKPLPDSQRQVEIVGYQERFAKVKKVDREVSDDKRTQKPLALYIRRVPDPDAAPAAPDAQSAPVFTQAGGDGWFELSPVAWARDGSHYAFATWEREKELLRVYIGDPAGAGESAKPELVLERRGDVGHEVVNVMAPSFTPDGQHLVLVLDDAGFRQPYAWDIAGRSLRPLLSGAFEAHQVLGFTPDSKSMFVAANKDDLAAMNLYRVNLADGAMQALGAAADYHRAGVASFDGRWLAANAGHWAARPELKLINGQQAQPEAALTLTDSHDKAWAAVDVLRPQRFSFQNRHGDLIPAYVFKPPAWAVSDRRPAVVYIYGGPLNDRHSVEVDSFQPSGYVFAMYMAAQHGYVMVTLDSRGHSNYGRRFADANWEQAGLPQTEDLADLHRYMAANLGVDGARVGLNGWSFGGFQTQYTLYSQPDVFAAGIAGAGPTEWENYNSWYSGRTIGRVDRSKPNLRKYSLLPLARGLKKPLLLVHGMLDPNVLYQDTVNVYRALLESGKEGLVELFLDPDGEHAMGGAVKAVGWHRKYEAFWLRHLGSGQ